MTAAVQILEPEAEVRAAMRAIGAKRAPPRACSPTRRPSRRTGR